MKPKSKLIQAGALAYATTAGVSAFPLIPLYHQSETTQSSSSALWNSFFNPIDQLFLNMNTLFGFTGPNLIENVVDSQTEITKDGYRKVTETIELVDENGRVEAIETRYTIEYDYDLTTLTEDKQEQLANAIVEDMDLDTNGPKDGNQLELKKEEEEEEESFVYEDEFPDFSNNNDQDYDLFKILGVFTNGNFDDQLQASLDKFNSIFNLDTYSNWPSDEINVEEYDESEDYLANTDSTFADTNAAGDLMDSDSDKNEVIKTVLGSELPDWIKEQVLGRANIDAVENFDDEEDIDGEDDDDDDDDFEDYGLEDEEDDDEEDDDWFDDDDDDDDEEEDDSEDDYSDYYNDKDDDDDTQDYLPSDDPIDDDGEFEDNYEYNPDESFIDQKESSKKPSFNDSTDADELNRYLDQLNWPDWMVQAYFGRKK